LPFTIVRQDITKMQVDAIVNAANTDLRMGGGVCGAIFNAAGAGELQAACDKLAPIKTGEAVITPAFALAAKYIIHAVGPVYNQEKAEESAMLLRSAYTSALQLSIKSKCASIAFPLLSSGLYGYPQGDALRVAVSAIRDFLSGHEMDVYLVVFDRAAVTVSEHLFGEVVRYIDDHYIAQHKGDRRRLLEVERQALAEGGHMLYDAARPQTREGILEAPSTGIEDLVSNLDEPFATTLLRLIDAKGKTDVEVYKRANLDRKLFSKIRAGKGYMPSKRTAIAFAVALELTLAETHDLLRRAGFALSPSQKFDVIVEFFIIGGKYDIFEINEVLFKFDQPLLGG